MIRDSTSSLSHRFFRTSLLFLIIWQMQGVICISELVHTFVLIGITGSEETLAFCKNLGADVGINYKTKDFVAWVKEETCGKGVDVILDNVGATYLQQNLDSLNIDGRLFIIGLMGGIKTEVDLRIMLEKRLTVQATGSCNKSLENKAAIVSELEKNV